ncbi:MAG: glycosyltransferase [Anaerolineae bacterium]|nr:glycosyltransferase [Candidatus Roseilinea sp.]MDW8450006.1 glycosyltransferase [Anaerolineae bacterium]
MECVITLHALCLILLSAYAFHQGVLLALYLRARTRNPSPALRRRTCRDAPTVTIQIPLFNERYVAERIIAAAASQDYPRDKLHIQVLDDSTDDTTEIARRAVARARQRGICIELLHRTHRTGYKAGALAAGLAVTKSELIAIFDADFLPAPDFLRRLICERHIFDDPRVGFVQTRWDYLNRDASLLTRAQAMTLDVHFMIEQPVRSSNGLLMNFNGSGGIWRHACIEDAGGWQHDTLTEDLDLSYRAELRGWRGVYLADESAPSELPNDVLAYKRQQARWARGTLQTVRKLLPHIASASLPLHCKLAAWMHLTGYFIHPLILLMSVTAPLLVLHSLLGTQRGVDIGLPMWVNAVSLLSFAPIASMFAAHAARGRPVVEFLRDLPATLMLGIGVSFSNTVAMLKALCERQTGDFARTPKLHWNVLHTTPTAYLMRPDWTMWIELGLALYIAGMTLPILRLGYWPSVVPMLLYILGFGGVWLNQMLNVLRSTER